MAAKKEAKEYTLDQLFPEKTAKLKLVHPAFDDLELTVEVYGSHVSAIRAQATETQGWVMKAKHESSSSELAKILRGTIASSQDLAGKAIAGWDEKTAKVFGEYSEARAMELCRRDGAEWLVEQVTAFLAVKSNFFRTAKE